MDLGKGRTNKLGDYRDIGKWLHPTSSLFPYLSRYLDSSTPVTLLEEEKTKGRHSCFQILQGCRLYSVCEPRKAELLPNIDVAVR